MIKRWRRGPSLRARLDAAQIGIVDDPAEEDQAPPAAAPDLPRFLNDPGTVIGDGSPQPPDQPADAHPLAGRVDHEEATRERGEDKLQTFALHAKVALAQKERDALAAELRRVQAQLAEEVERSLREASAPPVPSGKRREVVDSLREANQRLRAQLRSETDRADRAQTQVSSLLSRVAGLELTCQLLARGDTGSERPDVVVVDGDEMVVPWPSRT